MDEILNSSVQTSGAPPGLVVRYHPPGSPTLWHDVAELPDGRLIVSLGHAADPLVAKRLRSEVATVLQATGDPLAALQSAAGPATAGRAALCAAVDRPSGRLTYSSIGAIPVVITTPEGGPTIFDPAEARLASVQVPPGATVLSCIPALLSTTSVNDSRAALFEQVSTLHPEQAADRILGALPDDVDAALAVVYRQPPAPMELTVPADPTSLAPVRARLRRWLAMAGVDAESAADMLLAVGEAASNATEHSVVGADHTVELTVMAAVVGDHLRFTVADNGRWKPPPSAPGHRGHGIRLINALADSADVTTGERGTTVEMIKGWRQ